MFKKCRWLWDCWSPSKSVLRITLTLSLSAELCGKYHSFFVGELSEPESITCVSLPD